MGNALHTHRHGLQYICQRWPLERHKNKYSLSLVKYQFKHPHSRYDRGADRSPILLLLPYLFILDTEQSFHGKDYNIWVWKRAFGYNSQCAMCVIGREYGATTWPDVGCIWFML